MICQWAGECQHNDLYFGRIEIIQTQIEQTDKAACEISSDGAGSYIVRDRLLYAP